MRHIKLTGENAELEAKLRKKLFIASAYLAVSFALLILVSYGQYRIKVEGEAIMPEVAGMEASLVLDKNLAATVDLGSYLTDLQPGDSARTYASAYTSNSNDTAALNHKMQVTVKNSSTTQGGEGVDPTTITSDLNMDYTLRIYSTPGRIPLQFIMTKGDNKYISKRQEDGKEYRFYLITGSGNNETISPDEAEFTLTKTDNEQVFQIFVGWDNSLENATSLTDAAYRKELEMLELHADVIAQKPGSTIPTESGLKTEISENSHVVDTPEP